MGYYRQYHFESDPYCYCCGSRQAITLDAYIVRLTSGPGSRPKKWGNRDD